MAIAGARRGQERKGRGWDETLAVPRLGRARRAANLFVELRGNPTLHGTRHDEGYPEHHHADAVSVGFGLFQFHAVTL